MFCVGQFKTEISIDLYVLENQSRRDASILWENNEHVCILTNFIRFPVLNIFRSFYDKWKAMKLNVWFSANR